MKLPILAVISIGLLVFITGCQTPLDLATHRSQMARIVNVPEQSVSFISNCGFLFGAPQQSYWTGEREELRLGMVVLTDKEVILVPGTIDKPSPYEAIHLSLRDIHGVQVAHFGRNRQVQLSQVYRRVIIQIMDKPQNCDGLASVLVSKGIPKTAGAKWYFPQEHNDTIYVPVYVR